MLCYLGNMRNLIAASIHQYRGQTAPEINKQSLKRELFFVLLQLRIKNSFNDTIVLCIISSGDVMTEVSEACGCECEAGLGHLCPAKKKWR